MTTNVAGCIHHLHVHALSPIIERYSTIRSKLPLLVGPASAIRNHDRCAIFVVGTEAFRVICAGYKPKVSFENPCIKAFRFEAAEDSRWMRRLPVNAGYVYADTWTAQRTAEIKAALENIAEYIKKCNE